LYLGSYRRVKESGGFFRGDEGHREDLALLGGRVVVPFHQMEGGGGGSGRGGGEEENTPSPGTGHTGREERGCSLPVC